MSTLILHNSTAIHWAIGGAGVAAIALILLYVSNRRLGISTGLEDVCSFVLDTAYFQRPAVISLRSWRLPFIGGLILGGVLSAMTSGGWSLTWALGLFDERIGWGPAGKIGWMFVGGLFVGFGSRLAGGCTSGHSIFGLSNFELPSLVSTCCFLGAGLVTTHLVFRLIFR